MGQIVLIKKLLEGKHVKILSENDSSSSSNNSLRSGKLLPQQRSLSAKGRDSVQNEKKNKKQSLLSTLYAGV